MRLATGSVRRFQSALPARGATCPAPCPGYRFMSFNPRSPRGERLDNRLGRMQQGLFQSALPARGATPVRGGRRPVLHVSIRAPRAGSDTSARRPASRSSCFNPRSPRGERRRSSSRHPAVSGFNPRSPRGERPRQRWTVLPSMMFQSALPARGATRCGRRGGRARWVSIRAPRAGSDLPAPIRFGSRRSFNPRSPRGERRGGPNGLQASIWFQSALPARGATAWATHSGWHIPVSIRAPRAGSDPRANVLAFCRLAFQSALPARGATCRANVNSRSAIVSIRAPRAGSDVI